MTNVKFKSTVSQFMGESLEYDYLRMAIDEYLSLLDQVSKEKAYEESCDAIFKAVSSNPYYTLEDVYEAFEDYILRNEALCAFTKAMNKEIITTGLKALYGKKFGASQDNIDEYVFPLMISFIRKEKSLREEDPLIIKRSDLVTLIKKFTDVEGGYIRFVGIGNWFR